MSRRINSAANFFKKHVVPLAKTWFSVNRFWRLNHPVHIIVTLPIGGAWTGSIVSTNTLTIGVAALSPTKFLITALAVGSTTLVLTLTNTARSITINQDISVIP